MHLKKGSIQRFIPVMHGMLVELNLTEQQEAEAQLEASHRQPKKAPAKEKVAHLNIGSDEEEFPWSEVEDSESEVEVIEKVSN